MRVVRSAAVLILLGLILGIPGTSMAMERAEGARQSRRASPIAFELLGSLNRIFTSFWNKEGCRIDPLGQCLASTPTTDSGCTIDPLGCTQTPTTDNGIMIDPLGHGAPGH